jgi:antirestriction protein ArdC
MSNRDIYSEVTDKILAALESNPGSWLKPWSNGGAAVDCIPYNAVTGKPYRGVNVLLLWSTAKAAGYSSGRWASYNQWRDRGAQVRKGEKGTMIVFYKRLNIKDKTRVTVDGANPDKVIPLLRCWTVFNADQVDGAPAMPAEEPKPLNARIEAAEAFAVATKAAIKTGGNVACYIPALDLVKMPDLQQFHDTKTSTASEAYYSTLFHELTHWTSAKDRCARDLGKRFGDEAYAAEELIAEMGAAFLCAKLGISSEPRADHAQYIASWAKVLRGDKKAIFTAASKAAAAVDYLSGLQPHDAEEQGEGMEEAA